MSVLGVDIGGVIIERVSEDTDTSFFGDNYLQTPAVSDSFEVLANLAERKFGHNIYLVSKCGPKTQQKTLEWLTHHNFYERTGIDPTHVRFCLERSEKAGIAKELGLTHFIDDRLDVLSSLTSVPNRYLFSADLTDAEKSVLPPEIVLVNSWKQLIGMVN